MLGPLTRITHSLLGDSNAIKSRYRPTRVMGVVASVCTHTRIAIRGRSSKKKKKKKKRKKKAGGGGGGVRKN